MSGWADDCKSVCGSPAGCFPNPCRIDHPIPAPGWLGTALEACVRDVAIGRIAAHSNVTGAMVDEWRRMHGTVSTEPGSRDEASVCRCGHAFDRHLQPIGVTDPCAGGTPGFCGCSGYRAAAAAQVVSSVPPHWAALQAWDEAADEDAIGEIKARARDIAAAAQPTADVPMSQSSGHAQPTGDGEADEALHEWRCPSCGATTRARMADHDTAGVAQRDYRAENAAYRSDPAHMASMRAYGEWLAEQEPLTAHTCPRWHRDANGWCIDERPHLAAVAGSRPDDSEAGR